MNSPSRSYFLAPSDLIDLTDDGEFQSVYDLDGLQRSWINRATFGLFDPPDPPQFDYRPKR